MLSTILMPNYDQVDDDESKTRTECPFFLAYHDDKYTHTRHASPFPHHHHHQDARITFNSCSCLGFSQSSGRKIRYGMDDTGIVSSVPLRTKGKKNISRRRRKSKIISEFTTATIIEGSMKGWIATRYAAEDRGRQTSCCSLLAARQKRGTTKDREHRL